MQIEISKEQAVAIATAIRDRIHALDLSVGGMDEDYRALVRLERAVLEGALKVLAAPVGGDL